MTSIAVLQAEFWSLANESGEERTPKAQAKFIQKYAEKLDELINSTNTKQYFEVMEVVSKRLGPGGRPQVNRWLEKYGFNCHRF